MMVSKVLRTLVDKGFVSRKEHKTDTWAKIITLTPAGENVLQKAITVVGQADLIFFTSLAMELPTFNKHMAQLIKENKDV